MTEEQIKQKAEIQTKGWKEQNNCIQAYIAGYHECQKEIDEIKKKVIDIFANDDMQQGELWKACGLRLVGWDYEKNQLDDKFMILYGVSN